MAKHNVLGERGEALAEKYLLGNSYKILATNWRHEKSEVDIICKKDDILVFTEVKTRSSAVHGHPEEAVDAKKQEKLLEAAEYYIEKNKHQGEIRFDVISIILEERKPPEVFHIKDAFFPYQE